MKKNLEFESAETFPLVPCPISSVSDLDRWFTYKFNRYFVPERIGKWKVSWADMDYRSMYGDDCLAYELQCDWGGFGMVACLRLDLHSLVEEDGTGIWFLDVGYDIETADDVASPIGELVTDRGALYEINELCRLMKRVEESFLNMETHPIFNGNEAVARLIA